MVALRRVFVAFRQSERKRVDVTSGYAMHACTCSSLVSTFLLGQTLHAHDHSYYYLFWLRVEVQKATLSLVRSLRLITPHRPIRKESASSFVHELHKIVHDDLPLYVTPSLENSLVRSVSRWKTGSQRGHRFDRCNRPGGTIWK